MTIRRYKYEKEQTLPIVSRLVMGEKDKSNPKTSKSGRTYFPPKCLGHFRLLKNVIDSKTGEYLIDSTFPKVQELDIYLPNPVYLDGEWHFPYLEMSLGCYQSHKDGGARLFCYGDGIQAHRLDGGTFASQECDPTTCEFSIGKKPSCKSQGRLWFFTQDQRTGGACLYRTRSYTALLNFQASLNFFAGVLNGNFVGVPFRLVLSKEKATTPPPESRITQVWRVRLDGPKFSELEKYRARQIGQVERLALPEGKPELPPIETQYEGEPITDISGDDDIFEDDPEPEATPESVKEQFRFSPDEDEESLARRLEFLISQQVEALDQSPEICLQEATRIMTKNKHGFTKISEFFQWKGTLPKIHIRAMAKLAEIVNNLETEGE